MNTPVPGSMTCVMGARAALMMEAALRPYGLTKQSLRKVQ